MCASSSSGSARARRKVLCHRHGYVQDVRAAVDAALDTVKERGVIHILGCDTVVQHEIIQHLE